MTYDNLPDNIKAILDSWDDNKELYSECERIQAELECSNWTCDYDLSGQIFNVQPINK